MITSSNGEVYFIGQLDVEKPMQNNSVPINEAAKMLGRELFGRVPDVVGTSLVPGGPAHSGLQLFVDVDISAAIVPKGIPAQYLGYDVHIRRVGRPQFV